MDNHSFVAYFFEKNSRARLGRSESPMDRFTILTDALERFEAASFERPWNRSQIESWLRTPGARWRFIHEREVGSPSISDSNRAYLLVQDHPADSLSEILRIGTPPALRRLGLARRLIDRLIRNTAARAEKKSGEDWKIILEVSENNTGARALYSAAGFQESHRRRSYYADGSDALIMTLSVR
jgi:ribosomal-protein-alanine N-acetyltransferase